MARKPITVRLTDEEAQLLEQAARIDAVSQNEFVRQAVLDRIAARKAAPAFQPAVRRAIKATNGSLSGSPRRHRPLPFARGLPPRTQRHMRFPHGREIRENI